MNDLVEMLELKENLDTLINEAISELTVNEFVQLHEAGILTEGIGKTLGTLARKGLNTKFGRTMAKSTKAIGQDLKTDSGRKEIAKTAGLIYAGNEAYKGIKILHGGGFSESRCARVYDRGTKAFSRCVSRVNGLSTFGRSPGEKALMSAINGTSAAADKIGQGVKSIKDRLK